MKRLATAVGTVLLVLAWATPGGAHTELRTTSPPAGARLDRAPDGIVLRFTEEVQVATGGVRVFDSNARRVERGHAYHPDGRSDEVAVDLPMLDSGGYVVTWRVVSADSHSIRGAFTFQLESDDDVDALVARLLEESGGDPLVSGLSSVVRALLFGSLLVLVGAVAFVAGLWPAAADNRRARRVIATALGGATLATVAGVTLHGAYGAGLPLFASLQSDVVSAALASRYGQAAIVRLAALGVLALLLARLTRANATRPATALHKLGFGSASLLLLSTVVVAGHAISGRWVPWAIGVDLVHLAAGAIWIGGLTLLVTSVLPSDDAVTTEPIVKRFSRVALGCVVVLLATGSFQSLRQVGTLDALTATDYGRLLLMKLAAFTAMVGLAARSRSWIRGRGQGAHPRGEPKERQLIDTRSLRRSVVLETGVALVVLAVTALLVDAPPGRTALAMPYSAGLRAGPDLLVDLTVDPAKAGPVDVHLYTLTAAGLPAAAEEVTAQLTLRNDIGPIEVPLVRAGPNHFAAYGFAVPIAGQWRLDVAVRSRGIAIERGTALIPIR